MNFYQSSLVKIILLIIMAMIGFYCVSILLFQYNFFSLQESQSVEIQKIKKVTTDLVDTHEDFYVDDDKCTDGKDSCEFNEHFFGNTYYATGPENIDPVLHNDFSGDPIV